MYDANVARLEVFDCTRDACGLIPTQGNLFKKKTIS